MVWKGKWWNHFQLAALVDWVCEGGFSWNEGTKKTSVLAQAALIKYQHSLQQQILISHDSGGKAVLDRGAYKMQFLVSSLFLVWRCCFLNVSFLPWQREWELGSLFLFVNDTHQSHHGDPTTLMTSSKPDHFLEAPPLNTTTSRVRASTDELQGAQTFSS